MATAINILTTTKEYNMTAFTDFFKNHSNEVKPKSELVITIPVVKNIRKTKDIKPVPSYSLQKFPNGKIKIISIKDFLNTPTIPVNRSVLHRSLKTLKLLHNTILPKQNEVDILHYTGPTVSEPAVFVHDQMYVLNGNTRQFIWNSYYNGEILHAGIPSLTIPAELIASVYTEASVESAINLYYSIDSLNNVEKKTEKYTGALRAVGLLSTLKSKKIKIGQITTALNVMCPYGKKSFDNTKVLDELSHVQETQDVIRAIDNLDAFGKGTLSVQIASGMAMLAYKLFQDKSKWEHAVNRLVVEDPHNAINNCKSGIDWLLLGSTINPYGTGKKSPLPNALPYSLGQNNDQGNSLDYMAYCWMKYFEEKDFTKLPTPCDIKGSYLKLIKQVW